MLNFNAPFIKFNLLGDIICSGKEFYADTNVEQTHFHNISSEKFAQFKFHFKDDYLEPVQVSPAHMANEDEEEMCRSERKLIYPKRAMSKDSEWLTIAQYGENKQGIFVEQCL